MKISNLLLFAIFNLLSIHFLTAQDVVFKNGIVSIDGEQTYTYNRNINETLLYDLESEELVLHILEINSRQTIRLNFLIQDERVETSMFCGQTHRAIIRKLVERKIISLNGNINEKALTTFYKLYNEECISYRKRNDDDN